MKIDVVQDSKNLLAKIEHKIRSEPRAALIIFAAIIITLISAIVFPD